MGYAGQYSDILCLRGSGGKFPQGQRTEYRHDHVHGKSENRDGNRYFIISIHMMRRPADVFSVIMKWCFFYSGSGGRSCIDSAVCGKINTLLQRNAWRGIFQHVHERSVDSLRDDSRNRKAFLSGITIICLQVTQRTCRHGRRAGSARGPEMMFRPQNSLKVARFCCESNVSAVAAI